MSVIDSLEFARTGQTLSGSLQIAQLARLRDSLFDDRGELQFEVRGGHDPRRRPVLMLEISGVLNLRCQRCLGMLHHPLRLSSTLLLAGAGEAASDGFDAEDCEWIEGGRALDVTGLIEDEILLSLPYSPRHPAELCGQGVIPRSAHDTARMALAELAALKRNSN